MKKILATLALLAGALHILSAIPAYPGKILMTQPDGSVIAVRLHGDEWFHYITDENGQVIARGADGFFHPASKPTREQFLEAVEMREAANRMRKAMAKASSLTRGTHRIPVILVNFSDKEFVISDPRTAFSNMLNQEGYSANGGTGSVHDYYFENSHGAYDPVFEVFGPVTLSNTSEYYAYRQTARASEALREACGLLDSEIDFTRYDSDNDGSVDMILMYYAGYNQAEGGGTSTIWPHQSYASGNFDGKNLSRYFCTSELKGNEGAQMCGIGPTTHEFGHSLGLPDFYDTDYEDNGEAGALYSFSNMCSGSYNNDGRTPPYFNTEELSILGWGGELIPITEKGSLTIEPVQASASAYRTETTMDGEYFVYECRTQTGWDRYIPRGGLLVYHVDKANRESLKPDDHWSSYYTPRMLWQEWTVFNAINAFGDHPCFYIVPAYSQQSLNYTGREANIPFPGNRNVVKYTPVDWQEAEGDYRFSDISFNGSKVTMTVEYNTVPGISGTVMNTSAKPVRGAVVTLRAATDASAPAGAMAVRRAKGQPLMTVTTDMDGTFLFEDESLADATFTVSVSCDGYVETEARVIVGRRIVTQDFYLRKVGESEESTFSFYDPESAANTGLGSGTAGSNIAAAIRISAEAAKAHAGKQLKLISFQLYGDENSSADAVYVFVESGNRRRFTQKVENPKFGEMNTVNVIGQEYFIQSGQELYVGYGLLNAGEAYPLLVQECSEENMGYQGTFNVSRVTSWKSMTVNDVHFTPILSAAVGEQVQPELGFNYIANPGNGTYAVGDRFELALVRYEGGEPSSVSWVFDGRTIAGGSVTLTAGNHTVEAHLVYPDGAVEVIRLVIKAQ